MVLSLLAAKMFFGRVFSKAKANITLILIIIAVIGVLGSGFLIYRAGVTTERNGNQIEKLQGELSEMNQSFTNYRANAVTVDSIRDLQLKTTNTQVIVRDRIRDVPVKAEDRPFVDDPGLLDRASIMRNYQAEYTSPR